MQEDKKNTTGFKIVIVQVSFDLLIMSLTYASIYGINIENYIYKHTRAFDSNLQIFNRYFLR